MTSWVLASLQDSVVVRSPLPGGAAAVARFLLQGVPQWIQIGGFFVAVGGGVAMAFWFWRKRRELVSWFHARSRTLKLTLAAGAVLLLLSLAGFGVASWNYIEHENAFCTGCHVMTTAYVRFAESEHNKLSCHECHQQSVFASLRQLYLWVAERPERISPHAPVPNEVCARCHLTGEGAEVWRRIAVTAGHRTHLESDSSALADLRCVTCHGVELHRFTPVDRTCAQANCHVNTRIELGTMVGQTALHCVTCHQYTDEVPALATWDSAAAALVPGMPQCFSCHEMRRIVAEFDPAYDPHGGKCGLCHNPHQQQRPEEALATCASSQCHADWRVHPFHVGRSHGAAAPQCNWCHEPHRARVDASDCVGCHTAASQRPAVPERVRRRLQRAMPFDTSLVPLDGAAGLEEGSPRQPAGSLLLEGIEPPGRIELWSRRTDRFPKFAQDTFSHRQHSNLTCLACHETRTGHGRLTFVPPRGCQACHHREPASNDCGRCHVGGDLSSPLVVTARFSVAGRAPSTRTIEFQHAAHSVVRCTECHTEPISLEPASEARSCSACHDRHHAPARWCGGCHAGGPVRAAHSPPAEAHTGCDACHRTATIERLLPDRSFCGSCHAEQVPDHHRQRECTVCHLQATPAEFRTRLLGAGKP